MHNKPIKNTADAWLTFLSADSPEEIIKLIESYPEFGPMYHDIYDMCRNMEKVMGMFSKELLELDRNTVQYMIDEMQDTIDAQRDIITGQKIQIDEMSQRQKAEMAEINRRYQEALKEIERLKKQSAH